MDKCSIWKLLHFFNFEIGKVIKDSHPRSWHEDIITDKIVENVFSKISSINIAGYNSSFYTSWDAYKFSGSAEHKYGDIGIFVEIYRPNMRPISGLGFLEARKIYDNGNFNAVEMKQLRRIQSNSPFSQLLLYDYNEIYNGIDDIVTIPKFPFYLSHTSCMPLYNVFHTKYFDRNLYQFGTSLAYQILFRYLLGYDLDTRQTVIDSVKSGNPDHGAPRKLILIGVGFDGLAPTLPQIDTEKYQRIADDDGDKPGRHDPREPKP